MTAKEKLQAVPQPIRDWFWSDEMDEIILSLEEKFSLPDDEIILPGLLFDVEVKDLPLEQLETELVKNLELTPEVGRALYEDVKVRVFLPILRDLLAFGIGTATFSLPVNPAGHPVPQPTHPVPLPSMPRPHPVPVPLPTAAAPMPPPIPVSHVPAAPAPVAPVPAPVPSQPVAHVPPPAPVPLYHDVVASQVTAVQNSYPAPGTGNIAGSVASAPIAPRPARIDLGGMSRSPRKEEEFRSVFVERATPPPQKVDYSASVMPEPVIAAMPQVTPVPLTAAPAPTLEPDAPYIAPRIEVVSISNEPAPTDGEGGFFDSIMHRVAPWHEAKYGGHHAHATSELAAAKVDYTDTGTSAQAPAPQQGPSAPQA